MNAVDSTGYVAAVIVGPPLAASLFALWGGPLTFIIIGLSYGVAALVIARAPDPQTATVSTGRIATDAWQGLTYTWRNPTLRGLGFSISTINLANGAFTIIVPILVLNQFHFEKTVVGLVIAVHGLTGVTSAFVVGRHDSLGRERMMLALPMFATGITMALLRVKPNIVVLVVVMAVTGVLNGPIDIALFTVRQRRTDPSWTGRAFAVSMAFNYCGVPIGSMIAGVLASHSTEPAIVFCVVSAVISGMLALFMIPAR
jgi:predicted MFS family arabinose efflux permease